MYVDVEHWLFSRSWSYYCGPGREHGPDLQSFLYVCRLEGWGGGVLDEPSLHFPSGQQWAESSAVSSFLSLGVSMMFDTSSRRLLAGLLAVTNVWTRLPACRSQCTKCIFKITALPKSHQKRQKFMTESLYYKIMELPLTISTPNVHCTLYNNHLIY